MYFCAKNIVQNQIKISYLGGRMETKIKLNIGTLTDLNQITNVVVTSIACEYLIDQLRSELRKFSRDVDLKEQITELASIVDRSYDASFASFEAWHSAKTLAQADMLEFIGKLDNFLSEKGLIASRDLIDRIQNDFVQFVIKLSTIKITQEEIDLAGVDVNREYVASAVEQLRLLDEGILLVSLASMELEFTPIDTKQDRNKFVEDKLRRLDKLTTSCTQIFDNDYDKLLNQILAMHDKFYNVCYSSDTDGEKSEKARKILKSLNPHRLLLDKLENKLAEANELKRQLTIHGKKMTASLDEEKKSITTKLSENPEEEDILNNKLEAKEFVTKEYLARIETEIDALTKLQEKMTAHYKVLDQLEISLKGAIPTEQDMNKYSSIVHKFQELAVRLELDKSQPVKLDKEVIDLINTAIIGIQNMVEHAKNFKDLYLRNAMLTAIFRAVNDLNDFATSENKAEQLNQINYVANKLDKYNEQEKLFTDNIVSYRKLANDIIRNISIIISQTINASHTFEIIDMVDGVIKQFESIYQNLSDNQKKQIEIMKDIMTL